jgi:hypothetical protein
MNCLSLKRNESPTKKAIMYQESNIVAPPAKFIYFTSVRVRLLRMHNITTTTQIVMDGESLPTKAEVMPPKRRDAHRIPYSE